MLSFWSGSSVPSDGSQRKKDQSLAVLASMGSLTAQSHGTCTTHTQAGHGQADRVRTLYGSFQVAE